MVQETRPDERGYETVEHTIESGERVRITPLKHGIAVHLWNKSYELVGTKTLLHSGLKTLVTNDTVKEHVHQGDNFIENMREDFREEIEEDVLDEVTQKVYDEAYERARLDLIDELKEL